MEIRFVAFELSAAHLAECDAGTVVRVDVCRYLEDETGELLLFRLYNSLHSLCGAWTWSNLHEAVEQFLNTEVVEGRSEEYRGYHALTIVFHVELRVDTLYQFQVFAQFPGILFSDMLVELFAVDVNLYFLRNALFVRREKVELVLVDIIDTFELHTLVDRP